MRAWLITWEGATNADLPKQRIAGILTPDLSETEIATLLEVFYARATYTLGEQVAFVETPTNNPYRASPSATSLPHSPWRITCGHNPWLEARIVEIVSVDRDGGADTETLVWKEPLADGSSKTKRLSHKR